MFETKFDNEERCKSEKEEREDDDGQCVAEARLDAERFEKLVGPSVVAVDRFALEFRPVEAENGEKASVKAVLEE